jgi:hypothetical protein
MIWTTDLATPYAATLSLDFPGAGTLKVIGAPNLTLTAPGCNQLPTVCGQHSHYVRNFHPVNLLREKHIAVFNTFDSSPSDKPAHSATRHGQDIGDTFLVSVCQALRQLH